jgi:hypothetical protein
MVMNEDLKKLYNAVSSKFDIGSYEEFSSKMDTPDRRKSFYDVVSNKGFDLGDYDKYEERLKKKETTQVSSQDTQESSEQLGQLSSPQINGDEQESINLYAPETELKEPYQSPQPEEGIQEQELGVIDLTPTQLQAKLKQDIANEDPLMKSALETGSITPIEAAIQVKAQKQKGEELIQKSTEAQKIAESEQERVGFFEDKWNKAKASTVSLASTITDMPMTLAKMQVIMGMTGVEEFDKALLDRINAMSPKDSDKAMAKAYGIEGIHETTKEIDELSEQIRKNTRQYEGNITDALMSGNIGTAIDMTVGGVVESIPYMGVAMASLPATGVITAASELKESQKSGVPLSKESLLSSSIKGAAEGVFEAYTNKMLTKTFAPIKKLTKGNKELSDKVAKETIEKLIEKSGMGESLSESATAATGELSDALLLDKEINWKNIIDAALIGKATETGMSGVRVLVEKSVEKLQKKEQTKAEELKGAEEIEFEKTKPQTDEAISEVDKTKEIKQGEEVAPKEAISQEAMVDEEIQLEDPINDQEYNDFIDNGTVKDEILNSIADKIKKGETLSQREQAIHSDKTGEIENILKQETDAVQEPSASELDVQPKTKTSEEVVEGTSEAKPQEVAKESGTEQEGVQIKEQTKATEPTTDVEQEVKTESTRLAPKSEYTSKSGNQEVRVVDGKFEVLSIKNGEVETYKQDVYKLNKKTKKNELIHKKGDIKYPDTKTTKKVLNEYKEKLDYLSGNKGQITGNIDSFNEGQADSEIVSSTNNPGELIDIVIKRRSTGNDKLIAIAGTPNAKIAEALKIMSVKRDSFVENSDNNKVDRSIAMQYIAPKGKGEPLDIIAKEAGVTIGDVVNFIENNRGGVRKWENQQKQDDIANDAEAKFEELTGVTIDEKVIEEYNKQLNESFDIKDDIEQIKKTEYAPDQFKEYIESTHGQTESIDSRGEVDVESETLISTDKGRETKEEKVTPPSPPKSETKQVKEGGDKIYNNEAIFTGKKGKREQTIEPELTEEGKIKESISRESVDEEVARIINNNSKEDVDAVVRDKSNDMLPALRSGLLTQLAKNAKKDGDNTKAGEYFDLLAEVGTESAQEMSLRSDFSNDPEIVTLQVIRDNNKKKDSFRNNNTTTDGKTVGEHVDNSLSELKDIAAKLGLEVSDLQSVEKLIEKIVAKKISQLSSEKVKVSQAKIKKARAERKKITEEFKNKKDQLFYSSLIPGLTPEGVVFFGKIAKTYINEGVANTEILLEKLKQYARENFDVELSDADLEKIKEKYFSNEVKETIEDYKAEIKDIINDHYSKKDDLKRSLAEKIKDRLDLSESEAKKIESLVNSEFKNMMREEGMKELTKVYGTTKIPKKEQKKKKDDLDKIIEAYNMGAFDDNLFRDLIAEKFGYRILTDADIAIIDKYSNDIQELPPGELRNRKIQDLQTELYKIKDKTKAEEIGNTLLELFYISTLSGLSTVSRALKGGILTSSYDIAVSALTNPRIIRQSMGALMRGMNQYGLDGWWSIMKDGYSDVEFFEVKPKHRSKLEEITNKSFKELSKEDKKIAKMGVKAFLHVPVRVYRLLIANDAVMKAGLSEMHSYIEAYNNELLQGEVNRKEKEFWTKLNKKLAIDERSKKKAETTAEQEIEALIEKGEKIPFGYKKRRVQELINEIRNQNYENNTKIALEKANSALLMNDPVGTLGSLYRFIQDGVNIKEKDKKAIVIGKVLTRVIVSPFIRVATNFVNTGIDYAPGLSFVRLAKRVQGGVKKRDGYVKLTPKEKIEAAAKASIGLTISLMLTADMYDEDEDGNLIIDEDAGIQVTGKGPGTYSEGLSVAPDYKKYSFRFKNPLTNEWSSWYSYLDNPLGLMLAPHGAISDQISFKRFKKEVQGKDIYDGLGYTSLMNPFYMVDFAGSQTYSQGITSLTTILFGKGDLDKRIEASTDIITRPARGIMLPNLYKQTYQQYKSFTGKPQKLTSGYDRLIKDLPLLEDILSGTEYDQFGNPIVRDFEIPLVPDVMLDGLKSNRRYREGKSEWKAVYDFPEVNLGRTWKPLDKVNGKELTNEEKSKYLKLRGDIFKENFNKNIEKLKRRDDYNAIEVQKVINKLKIKATNEAKKQMFSDK